ncbi:MAG: hypothetical protein II720_00535 [Bacteroidales bacterium]|nr:hypothetical protein [Bacteroidales bacterium]
MKRIITIIAAVAAIMSLSSCEALLETITSDPMFQVRNLYDGQEFRIIRTGTCNYEWYGYNKDYVSLEIKGKEAWMTVTLPALTDHAIKTEISAKNLDKPEVTPQTNEFEIRPWKLVVFEADGDSWKEANPEALKVGKKYSLSMVCREYGKEAWTSVSEINYTTLENTSLEWEIAPESRLKDVEKHETYVTFTVKEPFAFEPCMASLPKAAKEIVLTAVM